jgi:ketosteroid isomerase-like protein
MNSEEQAALDAVMKFLDSYAKKDAEGCMSAMTVSNSFLMLGTNDNEIFKTAAEVGAAFNTDFASMDHIRWGECRNAHVEASPTLASVMVEMPIYYLNEGNDVKTLFRYVLMLIKENGQWKICSGMASVPFVSGTYSFPGEQINPH